MTEPGRLAVLGAGHVGPVIARTPGLTDGQSMTNIELYGQQVIPRARDLLS